jgi:hypothetical protein
LAFAGEVLAQADGVAVEPPRRGAVPPHRAQELCAGEHPRRLTGERDEQLVLLGRELDGALADAPSTPDDKDA